MKNLFLFLLFLFIFSSCKKDEVALPPNNNHVTVVTVSSQNIESRGVVLNGRIANVELPIHYGFSISLEEGGTYHNFSEKYALDGLINGEYSMEIRDDLTEGSTYYYNAFSYSSNEYTYGVEKSFVANGSAFPEINSVEPITAHILDTITIKGKYFSKNPKVFFHQREAEVLFKNDTLISCIVPYNYFRVPYESVKVVKNTHEETVFEDFSLYKPEIHSIDPFVVYETDTFTIHGDHFYTDYQRNLLQIQIYGSNDYQNLEIIGGSRTELIVERTGWFYELHPKIKIKSQYSEVEFENKIEALMPTITGVSDACIKFGEKITIYGSNFPRLNYSFVYDLYNLKIGETNFTADRIYKDSIVLNVRDVNYRAFNLQNVTINYLGNEIVYETNICISEPWVNFGESQNIFATHHYNNETYAVKQIYGRIFIGKLDTNYYSFTNIIDDTYLPSEIGYSNLVFKNDKLFHLHANSQNNNFYRYNIFTQELVQLTDFPGNPRINSVFEIIGDYIYTGFGTTTTGTGFTPFSDFWRYSIANDTWEHFYDFPGINTTDDAFLNNKTFVFNDKIYLFSPETMTTSNFWEFDPQTNVLTNKALIPTNISNVVNTEIVNNKGYLLDGAHLLEYDFNSDTWHVYQEIESGVSFLFTHNNALYNKGMYKLNTSYLN